LSFVSHENYSTNELPMQKNYTFNDLGILYIYNELDPETALNVKQLLNLSPSFREELNRLNNLSIQLDCLHEEINPSVVDNLMNYSQSLKDLKTC